MNQAAKTNLPLFIKSALLIFSFFCINTSAYAQQPDWKGLEKNIGHKRFLGDVAVELERVKQQMLREKNYGAAARCWYDELRIRDLRAEDTSFFKNSFFIDSIIHAPDAPPLLVSVMHVLQARRLILFEYTYGYRNNKNLFTTKYPQFDYPSLSRSELDSLAADHFKQAKDIAAILTDTPLPDLLWLSRDPLQFLFRPDYTDIIFAEQINLAEAQKDIYSPIMHNMNINLPPDQFMQAIDTINQNNPFAPVLKLYGAWANTHKNNPAIFYSIEVSARKYAYVHNPQKDPAPSDFEHYLQGLLSSPFREVKAAGIYELCLFWNAQADKYKSFRQDYLNNYSPAKMRFDTAYRYYYKKALDLFERNQNALDSFMYLKNILAGMKVLILKPLIRVNAKDVCLPETEMPLTVSFKNTNLIYFKVVRLNALPETDRQHPLNKNFLSGAPVFYDTLFHMPVTDDYQLHRVKISLKGLPVGRYAVLFSDSAIYAGSNLNYFELGISNLVAVNNDEKIFVLDRKTGFPATGAHIIYKRAGNVKAGPDSFFRSKKINREGYTVLKDGFMKDVFLVNGSDTISESITKPNKKLPDEVYDRERDDDLESFYKDNLMINIFTDRSVYRPGQTVFFKGIATVHDPKTGALVVAGRHLLKYLKDTSELFINNPFDKTEDTVHVIVNDFGSFSAAFKIPSDAATGEWSFDGDDIDDHNAVFHVEEYKRPSFELTIQKPKEEVKFGEDFSITFRVRSFAGNPMGNMPIDYSVLLNSDFSLKNANETWIKIDSSIIDTTAYTDARGELKVTIPLDIIRKYGLVNDLSFTEHFIINAVAADGTGESHEEDLALNISNRSTEIYSDLPAVTDRDQLPPVRIKSKNDFAGYTKKKVHVCIYHIPEPGLHDTEAGIDFLQTVNGWTYINAQNKSQPDSLVYETDFATGDITRLLLPKQILKAGSYQMKVTCTENGLLSGESKNNFIVLDRQSDQFPESKNDVDYGTYLFDQHKIIFKWVSANPMPHSYAIYHINYAAKERRGIKQINDYVFREENTKINEFEYPIPADANGIILLTKINVSNNEIFVHTKTVQTEEPVTRPDIIIERYRKTLIPGGKETFSVSIKTHGVNTAAELMTTMYDASLDKLYPHKWEQPLFRRQMYGSAFWPRLISTDDVASLYDEDYRRDYITFLNVDQPLWWLNKTEYANSNLTERDNNLTEEDDSRVAQPMNGRFSSVSISDSYGLSAVTVVTTAMGVRRQPRELGYAATTITGRTLEPVDNYKVSLVILDGREYKDDYKKINPLVIKYATLLRGADAVSLFGAAASKGVLILSTKEPIELPGMQVPPVTIRKNFSETAFFFPQIHADKDGMYSFSFTMPETATEWNWQLMAHTKNALFAFEERNIYTQLPLLVQPNIPRFLYAGDKIILKTRISNSDTNDIKGLSHCVIEDAITGEDITTSLVSDPVQNFSVLQASNTTVSYALSVPGNLLHPLRIKISAGAGGFSDGEEHIIPVMNRNILVSLNQPLWFNSADTTVNTLLLPADAKPYGIGLYITPKPQAAIINSLPYLAFDPYTCAEQTFNKLLAYSAALRIARTDTTIQKLLQRKDTAWIKQKEELPEELSEETMPWLQLNHTNSIYQNNLVKLFDTSNSTMQIEKYFNDLLKLQKENGGISWFPDGKEDHYISNYILESFGKLEEDHLPLPLSAKEKEQYSEFIRKLLQYCDTSFFSGAYETQYSTSSLFYLQARSYWLQKYPMSAALYLKANAIQDGAWLRSESLSLHEQVELIRTSLKYVTTQPDFAKRANELLGSLRQMAISGDGRGIRWKNISDPDDLSSNDEETIVSLAKAFESAGQSEETIAGIIKWLLENKQEHHWSTTKSTAEMIELLTHRQASVAGNPVAFKTDYATMKVTDDLFSGNATTFQPCSVFPKEINIKKDKSGPASGGINYYYFTQNLPVSDSNGIQITKVNLYYDRTKKQWDTLRNNTVLEIADKLQTVIIIKTTRRLNYVFIDEKTPAASEPSDPESGYESENGFSCYKSVRDAGYQFFAESVPAGISTISYERVVSQSGLFNCAPTGLECMYRPDIKAYATGTTITVK